tara:strand:+ start:250 stop:627 length:378 start_codon:yes stop_codon:yes gene_type:complete
MNLPSDLLYTKDHEWIKVDDDICKIGITDFAQRELGDIVFMEMPDKGESLKSGDSAGTIEAVKTVADVYSPIDGTVFKTNEKLINKPELINSDPYGEGWIVMLKINQKFNSDIFLNSNEYEEFIK